MSTSLIQFTPQVEVSAPPATVTDCDEIGQASRFYVSAHNRQRVHDVRLMSGELRCLIADFNGAISSSRTISSIKWRCDGTGTAIMSDAAVQTNARAAQVKVKADYPGTAFIRCEATLDNDEVYIAPFRIAVMADPYFVASATAGPSQLTATAS